MYSPTYSYFLVLDDGFLNIGNQQVTIVSYVVLMSEMGDSVKGNLCNVGDGTDKDGIQSRSYQSVYGCSYYCCGFA